MDPIIKQFQQQICNAVAEKDPIKITGGNSKSFLGREVTGSILDVTGYQGVISYEPTELYITVKAGTHLQVINEVLAENNQMLAFEPPLINENTTIGGVVATGLSGPRRPYSGAVRDYILGIRCLNGLGEDLSFGGQVMKNVAGYDLSRLMTGAYGTLGVILDVSLKVMPKDKFELTLSQQLPVNAALKKIHEFTTKMTPISGSCYLSNHLYIRLSGEEQVVLQTKHSLGMDVYSDGEALWQVLRDMKSAIFRTKKNLWRLSVPVMAKLDLGKDDYLIEWGGAQYWLESDRAEQEVFNLANSAGGSATLIIGKDKQNVFQPLTENLENLHQRLKRAFDPHRILNPGRMYASI